MASGPTESQQPLAEKKYIPAMDESFSGDQYEESLKEDQRIQKRIEKIRRIAKVELFFAVASITISAFILSCKPCGTEKTAASGIWCSVYFMVIAAMCIGKHEMISGKIMRIFGFVGIHFALLMFAVELLEAIAAAGDIPPNYVGATVHVALCGFAFAQLILVTTTVCLHSGKWRESRENQSSDQTNSKDDYILALTER